MAGGVTLGTGTLTLNQDFDSTFSGALSGTGGLTKNNAGLLTLSGINTYSGATKLNGGTLRQGAKGGFSGASAYSVSANSTLALNGFETDMVSLSNNGTTDFGGTGGTILNLAGDYSGDGGTLVLNAVLGDDSSKTDLLKVGGDTSGTSTVKVFNRGDWAHRPRKASGSSRLAVNPMAPSILQVITSPRMVSRLWLPVPMPIRCMKAV